MPASAPLDASATPSGSAPPVTDHVVEPVPPCAASAPAYATCHVPLASVVVSTTSGSGAIVIVTGRESTRFAPHESVACTTNVDEPQADGTPPMAPLSASNVSPPGSVPDAIDQVADPIAPLTDGVS